LRTSGSLPLCSMSCQTAWSRQTSGCGRTHQRELPTPGAAPLSRRRARCTGRARRGTRRSSRRAYGRGTFSWRHRVRAGARVPALASTLGRATGHLEMASWASGAERARPFAPPRRICPKAQGCSSCSSGSAPAVATGRPGRLAACRNLGSWVSPSLRLSGPQKPGSKCRSRSAASSSGTSRRSPPSPTRAQLRADRRSSNRNIGCGSSRALYRHAYSFRYDDSHLRETA
jgi:hypothetical protein